jgi:hypothetical protein
VHVRLGAGAEEIAQPQERHQAVAQRDEAG